MASEHPLMPSAEPVRGLCKVCSEIDLSEDFSRLQGIAWQAINSDPLKYSTIHMRSAEMILAAETCQLCALVLENIGDLSEVEYIYRRLLSRSLGHSGSYETDCLLFGRSDDVREEGNPLSIGLFVSEDSPLAKKDLVLGRPLKPVENNPLVLGWIDKCLHSHEECARSESDDRDRQPPTRLLDLGVDGSSIIHLRDGNQCHGRYATLSHCWGKSPSTITTKATLSSRMNGFDSSILCQTMRDAVVITRSIGIRYLWIDALCIVQDDHEDWAREAVTMAQVYTQSFITIAASSSADGDGGCFYPLPSSPSATLNWTLDQSAGPEKVRFRKSNTNRFRDAVLDGPLNRRAWVLQERSLSPRILYYSNDGLFWECGEAIRMDGNAPIENYLLWDIPKAKGFELSVSGFPQEPSEYHEEWVDLIVRYTACQLTNENDRLFALSGLAKVWAGAFGYRYVAGIMVDILPAELLWRKRDNPDDIESCSTQEKLTGLPSWSWCSFPGPVVPEVSHNPLQFYTKIVDKITVTANGSISDSNYGEATNVTLELMGKIKPVILSKYAIPHEKLSDFWCTPEPDNSLPSAMKFSFDKKPIYDKALFALGLYINNINSKYRCEYVLLMEKLGDSNEFRRIGVGEIARAVQFEDKTSWFDDAEEQMILIR